MWLTMFLALAGLLPLIVMIAISAGPPDDKKTPPEPRFDSDPETWRSVGPFNPATGILRQPGTPFDFEGNLMGTRNTPPDAWLPNDDD